MKACLWLKLGYFVSKLLKLVHKASSSKLYDSRHQAKFIKHLNERKLNEKLATQEEGRFDIILLIHEINSIIQEIWQTKT